METHKAHREMDIHKSNWGNGNAQVGEMHLRTGVRGDQVARALGAQRVRERVAAHACFAFRSPERFGFEFSRMRSARVIRTGKPVIHQRARTAVAANAGAASAAAGTATAASAAAAAACTAPAAHANQIKGNCRVGARANKIESNKIKSNQHPKQKQNKTQNVSTNKQTT